MSFGFSLHVRSDRPLAIADIRNVVMFAPPTERQDAIGP